MGKVLTNMSAGGDSLEDIIVSNVMIVVADKNAVVGGKEVTAVCNGKSWTGIMKDRKVQLYCSEVGTYTISATATDGTVYTTMLECPYFGLFATDICAGALVVTYTDEAYAGKTCTVRSCDDSYNLTDAYNLTRTFGADPELSFEGIPWGKYLVTVDGKYVFCKDVAATPDTMEVESKQWLFKDGEQCRWNTGGWLGCGTQGYDINSFYSAAGYPPTPNISRNTVLGSKAISFSGSVHCGSVQSGNAASGQLYSGRGRGYAYQGAASVKKIKGVSKFSSIHVTNTGGVPAITIRDGSGNNANTYRGTAKVLQSGTSELAIGNLSAEDAYILVDNYVDVAGDRNVGISSVGSRSGSFNTTVTEIYMK